VKIKGSKKLYEAIASKKSFLIGAHVRPDGDAWGSMAAMARLLTTLGKTVAISGEREKAGVYGFLLDGLSFDLSGSWEAFIALDCGAQNRIAGLQGNENLPLFNLDHHSDNNSFGTINVVEPSLSSTAELIWHLSQEWAVPSLPLAFYRAVYTGMMTDTGNFSFSNTTGKTLRAAADLVDIMGSPADLYARVYHSLSLQQLLIRGRVLSRMRLYSRGKLGVSHITLQDLQELGLTYDDLEGVADILRSVDGVEVYILMKEQKGSIRLSIRSKGTVPVRQFAAAACDEGGGHDFAAGASLRGGLEKAEDMIVSYWEDRL